MLQARIESILNHCLASSPATRWTAAQTQTAFEALLHSVESDDERAPPLSLAPQLTADELAERMVSIRKSIKKQRESPI